MLFGEITGLGGIRDPEDLRDYVAGALSGVVGEVEALGGTVNSISGSGLQAIFGAPKAHEDDPERAVRAAFRATSARDRDAARPPHRDRDGSGGRGADRRWHTPGVRRGRGLRRCGRALQTAAKPGGVLVGPSTRAATSASAS